jgi:hypothetical protein
VDVIYSLVKYASTFDNGKQFFLRQIFAGKE